MAGLVYIERLKVEDALRGHSRGDKTSYKSIERRDHDCSYYLKSLGYPDSPRRSEEHLSVALHLVILSIHSCKP